MDFWISEKREATEYLTDVLRRIAAIAPGDTAAL